MRRRILAIGSCLAFIGLAVAAQVPVATKFRYERGVEVSAAGSHRLDLDVALLSGGKPFTVAQRNRRSVATGGLEDLRFFDPRGQEVAYLLIDPPSSEPSWQDARVLPVAQAEKTSGFEADLGDTAVVDAIRVSGLNAPFLKRLVLEGSGDREHWTLLAAEGTLFDLPAESLQQTTLSFTAGSYRYLRVTWNDTNSGRVALPPSVSARLVPQPQGPASVLRAPLAVERRTSEPGSSRFRISLPAAQLPIDALELKVGGGHLLRQARVTEARLVGEQVAAETIGSTMLRRVVRDGIAADALRIPISQPHEAQLDLVVDDGDNPPLDLQGVTAVFAELPWIYFEQPPGTLTARYGDAKLAAPRYDLEAARTSVTSASTASVRWGAAQPATIAAEPAPALPMPETGSVLDAAAFQYSRSIAPGSGLTTVPLDAAALAHSGSVHTNFADVRVLDSAGRQVPYLLERRDEPIALDVRIEPRQLPGALQAQRHGKTPYFVSLPFAKLPGARLALHTRARVFDRRVTMEMLVPPSARRRDPHLEALSAMRVWQHSNAETPAGALVFDVPEMRSGEIVFLVDEGDNRPLPIEKATLLLPSYAVRLYRPAQQPLRLVYGRSDLSSPRYDLALLAPHVFGSVAQEIYPGREEPSRESSTIATIVSPPVFWASLGLAVVVLLALIVRLIRREDAAVSSEA